MTRQEYLLICLMEEASEVVQAASKALRFGLHESSLYELKGTNQERIIFEFADMSAAVKMLFEDVIDPDEFAELCEKKEMKLLKYVNIAEQSDRIK